MPATTRPLRPPRRQCASLTTAAVARGRMAGRARPAFRASDQRAAVGRWTTLSCARRCRAGSARAGEQSTARSALPSDIRVLMLGRIALPVIPGMLSVCQCVGDWPAPCAIRALGSNATARFGCCRPSHPPAGTPLPTISWPGSALPTRPAVFGSPLVHAIPQPPGPGGCISVDLSPLHTYTAALDARGC